MKEQLGLEEILNMFLRRWWVMVICAVTFSVVSFFYAQFMVAPLYRTDGTLYVNASKTETVNATQANMSASQQLAVLYKEILSRRTFLSKVASDVDNKYTVDQLAGMISMGSINETEIMGIRVVGEIPQDVYEICHSVLINASDELTRVVNAGSVKILDDGQLPEHPFSPNVKTYALFAFIIGFIFGAVLLFGIEVFDTRVKTREDIEKRYQEPLLGEIPELLPDSESRGGSYMSSYEQIGGGKA